MALTPKQERFCTEILSGKNASDAYRAAYDAKGMKAETIHRASKTLMDNSKIAARIAELRAPVLEQAKIDAAWVLERLVDLHGRCIAAEEYSPATRSLELLGKHVAVSAFGAEKLDVSFHLADRISEARKRIRAD